jgi:hypothetical protein
MLSMAIVEERFLPSVEMTIDFALRRWGLCARCSAFVCGSAAPEILWRIGVVPLTRLYCGIFFELFFQPARVDRSMAIFWIGNHRFKKWNQSIDATYVKIIQCFVG